MQRMKVKYTISHWKFLLFKQSTCRFSISKQNTVFSTIRFISILLDFRICPIIFWKEKKLLSTYFTFNLLFWTVDSTNRINSSYPIKDVKFSKELLFHFLHFIFNVSTFSLSTYSIFTSSKVKCWLNRPSGM